MNKSFLQIFKEGIAKIGYGKTRAQAHESGTCIHCNKVPDFTQEGKIEVGDQEYYANLREFQISGICPACWDILFSE
jgi:hypothetical protein